MEFLGAFYRNLVDVPLDPASDSRYVPLYGDVPDSLGEDPVDVLARAIQWLPGESSQLVSGFRGTGKSTELRRLRNRLREAGYFVVLLDMEHYVNMSTPIDVSDFLIALAGAAGEALAGPDFLGVDEAKEGYWARFSKFVTEAKISISDASAAGVKVNLRNDPSFRQEVQARMAGHVGALFRNVSGFFDACLKKLKAKHGDGAELVVIVDSLDHVRGTSSNDGEVQASVENLFAAHAERLRIPNIHVIYTVPVYLKVQQPTIGARYGAGQVPIFPAVKIRHEASGEVHVEGIAALRRVVAKRGDVQRVFGGDELLDQLIVASGGQLRDLTRLVRSVLQRAQSLPVDAYTVAETLDHARAEMVPIPDDDARWLARIAVDHAAPLGDSESAQRFAWCFRRDVLVGYGGDRGEVDVHPLVKDHVMAQAHMLAARGRGVGASGMRG